MHVTPRRFLPLLLCLAAQAFAAPTIIGNVQGHTLLADGSLHDFAALAFDQGHVLDTGDVAALRARYHDAAYVDGHGATLLPGLIDSHGHVLDLGLDAARLDLVGTTSLAEALARLKAYAASHRDDAWLFGSGWNQVIWRLGRFPTAAEIDAIEARRPVVLGRVDGHAKWLNSRALALAGITRDTPDPQGGRIERDAAGNATGVLVDNAMDYIDRVTPPPSLEARRTAVLEAIRIMNSVGLTGVADAGCTAADIGLYRELDGAGRLDARIYAMIRDVGGDFDQLAAKGPVIAHGDSRLTVRSVKLFADGALGSRGAALLEPYSDSPGKKGLLFVSNAEMNRKVAKALKAGYQVNVHAIGDAANRQVLDAFEAAFGTVGGRDLRNRIEHAQIIAPSDIPRLAKLGITASMQPTHATSDMNMAEDRLGRERLAGAYAWRTLLAQGTRIAGGSDFPVESPNPFYGLYSAVTRQDHAGLPPGGWLPAQRMTRLEALRAFTLDGAWAQHQEKELGTLEPGKWADFILIDTDVMKAPEAQVWRTKVRQTWVGGRKVYDAAAKS